MKIMLIKFGRIILLFSIMIQLGCRPDADPSERDLITEQLSGTWTAAEEGAIIIDGVDHSANFSGFSLVISDRGYTTTNAGDLFHAQGTWDFAPSSTQEIILDDGKLVTIISLSDTGLIFSFENAVGGVANHINSISGSYTINLGK